MLSPFLKEHKKNLRKLTKKQLIQQILIWLDMNANQSIQFDMAYEKLDNEKQICESELIRTEWFLKSAESAIRYYENFSIFQFIKHKYSK